MNLYRKFRPTLFNSVKGQENIINILKSSILNKNISHAYIFTGTRGVGKTTMARIFAKAINCLNSLDGEPCNVCDMCKSYNSSSNVDFVEIDAASNRGIDDIRDIREKVNFMPTMSTYKIYIIDEVHMLTKDAFNALLKTLEEPPKNVIFILATTEIYKVPLTILSRCQRFDFKNAGIENLNTLLREVCIKQKIIIDEKSIDLIADLADGSYRDALSILDKVSSISKEINFDQTILVLGLPDMKSIASIIKDIKRGSIDNVINTYQEIINSGVDPYQFNKNILRYLEDILMTYIKKEKTKEIISLQEVLILIKEFLSVEEKLKQTQVPSILIKSSLVSLTNTYGKAEKSYNMEVNADILNTNKKTSENKVKVDKLVSNKELVTHSPDIVSIDPSVSIKIEEIQGKWNRVIAEILPLNHHLSSFLSQSLPLKLEGNKLVLEVRYQFHKDSIEAEKGKIAFSKTILNLFKIKLIPFCIVNGNLNINKVKNVKFEKKQQMHDNIHNVEPLNNMSEDVINEALKIFDIK